MQSDQNKLKKAKWPKVKIIFAKWLFLKKIVLQSDISLNFRFVKWPNSRIVDGVRGKKSTIILKMVLGF